MPGSFRGRLFFSPPGRSDRTTCLLLVRVRARKHFINKYSVTSADVQTWWTSSHRLGHDLYHFWQCLEAVEGRWVHLHPKTTPTAQCAKFRSNRIKNSTTLKLQARERIEDQHLEAPETRYGTGHMHEGGPRDTHSSHTQAQHATCEASRTPAVCSAPVQRSGAGG